MINNNNNNNNNLNVLLPKFLFDTIIYYIHFYDDMTNYLLDTVLNNIKY